ncbi:MAG: ATP-grasp domain-containing protein [Clostridiales bacterium]|nr:ATP-grasp domain-containing protein [Clostridiales bacterium]
MLNPITILLTGTGAPGAPGIIKCLRKNGERSIRIVGVDMNENAGSRGMVDTFYTVPSANDDAFISTILRICEQESVNVVEPIVTRELMKFAIAKEEFSDRGVAVISAKPEVLQIINNKARLLTAMHENGLPTPDFVVVHTLDELIQACKEIGYPQKAICIKGAVGNGSRGVRIIDPSKSRFNLFFEEKPNSMFISYEEAIRTLSENEFIPEMLVMEYLPGDEYGVDVLCDNGRIIAQAGRYNQFVNSSIPQGCIIEKREEPFELASRICQKFQIDGHANFDFKYNSSGEAKLLEINPRLSATIVAYAAAGINFPYLGIKHTIGETFIMPKVRYGIRMARRYQEEFFDEENRPIEW